MERPIPPLAPVMRAVRGGVSNAPFIASAGWSLIPRTLPAGVTCDRAQGYAACVTSRKQALRVTADGSRTLFDEAAGQTLHSEHGAVAEARHVYVEGSGVAERIRRREHVTVFEVGLGAGLNLLLTLDLAVDRGVRVTYRAVERVLLPAERVAELAWGTHLRNPGLADVFVDLLDELAGTLDTAAKQGDPVLVTRVLPGGSSLELAFGDAVTAQGAPRGAASRLLAPASLDAVYHDAFSPAANPRLWSEPFLAACAGALRPGGAWASYSVAGVVRRALAASGLEVEKRPGPPGGKREMLVARRPAGG